jgi:hypothetical protein
MYESRCGRHLGHRFDRTMKHLPLDSPRSTCTLETLWRTDQLHSSAPPNCVACAHRNQLYDTVTGVFKCGTGYLEDFRDQRLRSLNECLQTNLWTQECAASPRHIVPRLAECSHLDRNVCILLLLRIMTLSIHVLAQEVLNVLEVASFCTCIIMRTIRQLPPYFRRLANLEQSAHV